MSKKEPRKNTAPPEETLDPRDWGPIRELGHRMLDDMMDYLETVRERPAWVSMPDEVERKLKEPLPLEPQGEEAAYRDFRERVLPYPIGNIHPRFWGWVQGTGSALDMLSEMLAAGMNPNAAGFRQASTFVELQVLDWLREMLGYPEGASGILVSGGSVANMVGLAVARNSRAGFDLRRAGLHGGPGLTLYASSETHSSVQRSVELMGLGSEALRLIPAREDLTLDLQALEAAIREDRSAGLRPITVIGHAGTVNSGAVDDLEALADLCHREELWLHVDGAFGALAWLSPELRPRLRGMERADSLAFDLHKWMYLPYEVGCTLVRDAEAHRKAFALMPSYLSRMEAGVACIPPLFSDYGMELSRGFRALKVWMALKARGVRRYARLIEQNVAQAAYLTEKIRESPRLELAAPAPLNIVCFRVAFPNLPLAESNDRNRCILEEIQEQGIAVPSTTVLDGRLCIRVAITNHRTTRSDLDLLVREVERLGRSKP
jgi:glutamate/tyrosine decarboxylase-like PLP-dependent enzyme